MFIDKGARPLPPPQHSGTDVLPQLIMRICVITICITTECTHSGRGRKLITIKTLAMPIEERPRLPTALSTCEDQQMK